MEGPEEYFKVVQGFDGYEIGDRGTVHSTKHNKIRELKLRKDGGGYLYFTSCEDGKHKSLKVHRLVAIAWVPNPNNEPCVNHKNRDRSDNRAENLEWCTREENMSHAWGTGLCNEHPF